MMRDVSDAKFIKEEPRGANKKSWLLLEYKGRKRTGLFKPTYVRPDGTNTQTHFGELLYSEICKKLLHFPCADIELAERKGQFGCVSYNVLENIPDNNEDYTRYNLIDMVSIIQRIRENFDASGLKIKGTQEYYSLDLLMEAIDNYIPDEEQNKAYKDYLLYLCLLDSGTNYFDRHALNLAAAEERTTGDVLAPETFDNGTCFGLGIRKDELRECLESEDGIANLRKRFQSKIGIDSEAPIPFERLETLIFNHYFNEAAPLYERFQRDFTPEGIREILNSPQYDELDDIYKQAIIAQVIYNKRTMAERYAQSKKRNEIESLLCNESDSNELNKKIAKYFENADFEINGEILDDQAIQTVRNIEHIPDKFESGTIKLSYGDKNIAEWTVLIKSIMRRMDPNIPDEAKKMLIKDFIMKEFNFCQRDFDKIQKLVDVYEFRLDEDSAISVRKFIFGTKDKEGLGLENVGPFIAFKLAESDVSERHKERYDKFIELYGEVLLKEEFINQNMQFDKQKTEIFKKIGITDSEEIIEVLYNSIDVINREGRRFASTEEYYDFLAEIAKKTFQKTKTEVNGVLIDNEDKEFLEQCTYETGDGKKITIVTETLKNSDFLSYALGASYFASIGEAQNGKGRSMIIAAKEGETLPENVLAYAENLKKKIADENGKAPNDGEITISGTRAKKKAKSKDSNAYKSGLIISIGAGKKSKFALTETPEELKKMLLGMFKTKERSSL